MGRDTPLLFAWREALMSEAGPDSPTTRHVLLTLSCRMDQDGSKCFPSTRTIATMTALHRKTVEDHLERVDEDGWLIRIQSAGRGRGWKRTRYLPRIPTAASEGGSPRLPPQKAEGGRKGLPPQEGRGSPQSDGGSSDVHDVGVEDSHTSSVTSKTSSSARRDSHARGNGGPGSAGLRKCPSCGKLTKMPDGPCPGSRARSRPPVVNVDAPVLPDPENMEQVGDRYWHTPIFGEA